MAAASSRHSYPWRREGWGGEIQTDRGNLHVDGSPHVIRLRRTTLWHFDAGSGRRPPHQTRTSTDVCDTTASPPQADITASPCDVADVPGPDLTADQRN